jgi:CRISPR type IV-associated protein Csf3
MPLVMKSRWLNFDGILSYLQARAYLGRDYYLLPSKTPLSKEEMYSDNLPPQLVFETDGLVHASVAEFDASVEMVRKVTLYKRIDEATLYLLESDIRRINVGSGIFRAYMMSLPLLPASKASFYINGDLQGILELCQHLVGLGADENVGFGDIRSVSVEETPEDYSLVKDGVAMRPLPTKLGYRGTVLMWLPWQAPYWGKQNVASCVAPGAHVFSSEELAAVR